KLIMRAYEKGSDSPLLKHAATIYEAGNDLLSLINDILDLSKIEAGKAVVTVETMSIEETIRAVYEQFLPQALGLEERGGLSYRKGCYPGQEVIARVHFLGKAKERLLAFRLEAQADCSDQDLLDDNGQRLGRTLQSACTNGGTVGLAVVGVQHQPGQPIRCADHAGRLSEPADLC
ncbi:MAG: hypothetical protein ACOCVP_00810, partial [Wenzhouxiangella sp.]